MDYCRVVGPRGLCRPLDEKQGFPTNTSPLAPFKGCSKAGQRATFRVSGQGQGKERRKVGREKQAHRHRPLRPQTWPKSCGAHLYNHSGTSPGLRPAVRRSRDIVPVYREALPSLTVLSRRSAGGLSRSRSLERPCKWSAALLAVWGLGFRVKGSGFRV